MILSKKRFAYKYHKVTDGKRQSQKISRSPDIERIYPRNVLHMN